MKRQALRFQESSNFDPEIFRVLMKRFDKRVSCACEANPWNESTTINPKYITIPYSLQSRVWGPVSVPTRTWPRGYWKFEMQLKKRHVQKHRIQRYSHNITVTQNYAGPHLTTKCGVNFEVFKKEQKWSKTQLAERKPLTFGTIVEPLHLMTQNWRYLMVAKGCHSDWYKKLTWQHEHCQQPENSDVTKNAANISEFVYTAPQTHSFARVYSTNLDSWHLHWPGIVPCGKRQSYQRF